MKRLLLAALLPLFMACNPYAMQGFAYGVRGYPPPPLPVLQPADITRGFRQPVYNTGTVMTPTGQLYQINTTSY